MRRRDDKLPSKSMPPRYGSKRIDESRCGSGVDHFTVKTHRLALEPRYVYRTAWGRARSAKVASPVAFPMSITIRRELTMIRCTLTSKFTVAMLFTLATAVTPSLSAGQDYWPGAHLDWERLDPASAGFDPVKLAEAVRFAPGGGGAMESPPRTVLALRVARDVATPTDCTRAPPAHEHCLVQTHGPTIVCKKLPLNCTYIHTCPDIA